MTATVRQLTNAVVVEQPKRAYRMCPFCGRPCEGRACMGHRDLILIEHEIYAQSNETTAPFDPGSAAVSQQKGF